jgi:hypothetical protein
MSISSCISLHLVPLIIVKIRTHKHLKCDMHTLQKCYFMQPLLALNQLAHRIQIMAIILINNNGAAENSRNLLEVLV